MSPYFFRRDTSDVLRETVEELFQLHLSAAMGRPTPAVAGRIAEQEREVLREQRRTLFEHDDRMRELFRNDFDAFCAAMDNPDVLTHKLEEHQRARDARDGGDGRANEQPWDDESPGRSWEEQRMREEETQHVCAHDHAHHKHAGDTPSLDTDPIYGAAFRWACRVERWARAHYAERKDKDRDLYRVCMNVLLVPAKVAYGFPGTVDASTPSMEVSAIGYRQASIFCMRVLDSLANCYGKRIGDRKATHAFLDEGRELLADIQSKLAEIEEELRFRQSP